MNKIINYLKEVRLEMTNVTWPSRSATIYFTIAVVLISGFIAYFLGFFDYLFKMGLKYLLTKTF